jgi:hypothetical protein
VRCAVQQVGGVVGELELLDDPLHVLYAIPARDEQRVGRVHDDQVLDPHRRHHARVALDVTVARVHQYGLAGDAVAARVAWRER